MYINRLKNLREENSLSQKEVAEKLGISERNYRRYEKNELDIPSSVIIKLSEYYTVSSDYIIGISELKDIKRI